MEPCILENENSARYRGSSVLLSGKAGLTLALWSGKPREHCCSWEADVLYIIREWSFWPVLAAAFMDPRGDHVHHCWAEERAIATEGPSQQ